MSRGHSDHDHSRDEKLKDAPEPVVLAESPAPAPPDAPDPSINPPPEPVEVADETLAHVHDLLSKIVAAMQVLAAQMPAGHGMQTHFSQIRSGLAALFDRAHQK
jgi:hypothetical protein